MRAVFIDGASLLYMTEALGIRRIDFRALYDVLTNGIGEKNQLLAPPFITLPINIALGVGNAMRKSGFSVMPHTSGTQKDDAAIIERIKSLDSEKVSEIVLVSADQDYIRSLMPHAERGVRVYIVATKAGRGSNGSRFLTGSYDVFFESGKFSFVELNDFKSRLARAKSDDAAKSVSRLVVKITAESADEATKEEIIAAIRELGIRFPAIRVQRIV